MRSCHDVQKVEKRGITRKSAAKSAFLNLIDVG